LGNLCVDFGPVCVVIVMSGFSFTVRSLVFHWRWSSVWLVACCDRPLHDVSRWTPHHSPTPCQLQWEEYT